MINGFGAELITKLDRLRWGVIRLPRGRDVFQVIDSLSQNPIVEVAEPRGVLYLYDVPNDYYYQQGYQWSLHNTGQSPTYGSPGADINVLPGWNITTGDPNVVIGILDTGIPLDGGAPSHPDLGLGEGQNGKRWAFRLGPNYSGDGNGSVNDLAGHGTHVLGIVAAERNSIGVAGIASGCTFLIVKVIRADYPGSSDALHDGILYAVENGAKIINISGGTNETEYQNVRDAVDTANSHGVLLVCAAGNNSTYVAYPAAYAGSPWNRSNVVAVGATDRGDAITSYSGRGSAVTVVAPGGDQDDDHYMIFSTLPGSTYGWDYGASMAAPHVTGIAGLMLSVGPDLSPSQIGDILKATTDNRPATVPDNAFGYGRVNAGKAVDEVWFTYHSPNAPDLSAPANSATVTTSPVLSWNPPPGATSYRVQVATDLSFPNVVVDVSGITTTSYSVSGLANRTMYWWRVNATNSSGTGDWSSASYFVTTPPHAAVLTGTTTEVYQLEQLETVPSLSWTTWGQSNVTYGLYRYYCNNIHHGCDTTDCEATGELIYNGSETSYVDPTFWVGDWNCFTVRYYVDATATANGSTSRSNKVWYSQVDPSKTAHRQDKAVEVRRPSETALDENYPDPFNPTTTIKYELANDCRVALRVYNLLGQIVATLKEGVEPAGYKQVEWNASNVASGVYFYRLEAVSLSDPSKGFTSVKKMLVAK